MDTEALHRSLVGESDLALERLGEAPMGENAIRTLAIVVIAARLGELARTLEACRDGDTLAIAAWSMGPP